MKQLKAHIAVFSGNLHLLVKCKHLTLATFAKLTRQRVS